MDFNNRFWCKTWEEKIDFYLCKLLKKYWRKLTLDNNDHIDATGISKNVDAMNAFNMRDSDLSSINSKSNAKFVSVTGKNSNPGTIAKPFKSIQYAINQAKPGDIIYLLEGTYRERIILPKSGDENNPIKLVNYPGTSPIIDGKNIVWDGGYHGGLISIDGKSNWVFEGIKLINASAMGFGMEKNKGGSENVTIKNCSVIGAITSGIYFEDAKNIIIENCYIENVCKNLLNECITIQNVDGFEVLNCTIKNSYKEGIDAKNGSRNGSIHDCRIDNTKAVGIYIDAYSRNQYNIKVFNNMITGVNGAGISTGAEYGGKLQDVLIRNNIVYDCSRGYNVAAYNDESNLPYSIKNITIRNNIAFNVTFTGVFITCDVKNLIIENNILFSKQESYGIHVYDLSVTDIAEITIRNNLFRDMIKSKFLPIGTDYILLSKVAGANNAYDKVFKDATGKSGKRDFTLAANSPAKGSGYQGVDMGAYGYPKEGASELGYSTKKDYSKNYYTKKFDKLVALTNINVYADLEFKKKLNQYKKDTNLTILDIAYAKSGVPRFKVNGGYVTANRKYVKASNVTPEFYAVKSGDTLSKIATKNNTTIEKLKELNKDLKNFDKLTVGQKVRIK